MALTGWPRNAIDHFVLARLEQEHLAPAPEADRATLIRRVSLFRHGAEPREHGAVDHHHRGGRASTEAELAFFAEPDSPF